MKRFGLAAVVVLLLAVFMAPSGGAQAGPPASSGETWTLLADLPPARDPGTQSYIQPDRFQALTLDQATLLAELAPVPVEPSPGARPSGGGDTISLPDPDGNLQRFEVFEAPIMEPGLAAQFPDIRTYAGQGIDDPAATLRFDVSDQGFHAQVLSPDGAWYIDPYYHLETTAYISYYKRDLTTSANPPFTEQVFDDLGHNDDPPEAPTANRSGTQLRTHRLAVAATGEYTAFHGGTVPAAQAAQVTAINRVNGIYEQEIAIRLVIVANNNLLIYTNAATDPYTGGNADININQTNVDAVIGNANYDIGHVFNTGSGLAGLGVVGVTGQKARGTTGIGTPVNDPFTVDYVAHEMGHQYGGNHTFNGIVSNCNGNGNAGTAYEPGSASTIQGYAGICGLDNLQVTGGATGATGASDPYFHSISFDEIIAHTTGGSPGDLGAAPTGNNVPTANAGPDGTIPASTPFLLEGAGTDADGADVLTYNWEQRDLGAFRALNNPQITAGPLFRSVVPTQSSTRYLPKLSTVAAGNTNVPGPCPALTGTIGAAQDCWSEFIPTAARTMNFRVTVRDNRAGGGGVNTDDMVVTVNNTGAAFAVTSQAAPVTYPGGSNQTVTWNVAGTTTAPISAPNVDIKLSTDGGLTFPTTLATNTPNDGTQAVTLPTVNTSLARVMVVEAGTGPGVRFFNVNTSNFTIGAGGCVNNDDFACATVLGGPPATVTGNNTGFGVQTGEPAPTCQANSGASAWWKWTAPNNGNPTVNTEGSGLADTVLTVYTGAAVNALTEIGCDDDGGTGFLSTVTFAATAGTNYYISVRGFGANTGPITLNITSPMGGPTCNGLPVTVDLNAAGVPTAGDDVILGTPGADVINAVGGNDTICGEGGDDTINAGPGNDTVFGGLGNDTIFGADGNDTLNGDAGNDIIQGNAGVDTINGGDNDDQLSGNDAGDTLNGDAGNDTLYGVAGADNILGGAGTDTILGGLGIDNIDGGPDNDLISGNADGDIILGGLGNDTLYGVDGNDNLNGGAGTDIILGGLGNDTIDGGDDIDQLSGNENDDTINGGAGNDNIYGVDGNDNLNGGLGTDTILGGNGTDTINGGDGDDLLSGNNDNDTITGGTGNDTIYGVDGNDNLTGNAGTDTILGGNNDDTINSLDGEIDQVSGNAGNDTCTRDTTPPDNVFACEILLP